MILCNDDDVEVAGVEKAITSCVCEMMVAVIIIADNIAR